MHKEIAVERKELYMLVALTAPFAAFWTLSFCNGLHKLSSQSWPSLFWCSVALSTAGSFSLANLPHQVSLILLKVPQTPLISVFFCPVHLSIPLPRLAPNSKSPSQHYAELLNALFASIFHLPDQFLELNFSWPNDLLKCFAKKKNTGFPLREILPWVFFFNLSIINIQCYSDFRCTIFNILYISQCSSW